jgi:hypothetical protein
MSGIEQAVWRRFSGSKIVMASLAVGLAGTVPLLLYIAFGPADGNPIGLGLLAAVSVPVAAVGVFAGLISMLVQYVARREK